MALVNFKSLSLFFRGMYGLCGRLSDVLRLCCSFLSRSFGVSAHFARPTFVAAYYKLCASAYKIGLKHCQCASQISLIPHQKR